ncbi:MAG: four helix bundle protein [Acidobacteriota bacterium]
MENVLREKSYKFALRMVNLYKYLTSEKKKFILSKQALRSGTSIGAMWLKRIKLVKSGFCSQAFYLIEGVL